MVCVCVWWGWWWWWWWGGVQFYAFTWTTCVARAIAGVRTHAAAIVWVSHPAPNPLCHKVLQWLPSYSPFVISERCLSALAPNCCPPSPPTVARLDLRSCLPWPSHHSQYLVRIGPQSWLAVAPDRGPPWHTILACFDLLWASTQKSQARIVQYNQFTVNAGTSDSKCRRSHHWGSNPRRCDCLSQPSSTQPTVPQEYSVDEADKVWPSGPGVKLGVSYSHSLCLVVGRQPKIL